MFYFKPSNRRINPLNRGRPDFLDVSKPEAKQKVRHVFMLSSDFSVLDYDVNVKVHRNLFTDVIHTEKKHYRIIDRKHINIVTDCLTLEGGTDRLSRNVRN